MGTIPTMHSDLIVGVTPPVQACNAGLFISRGRGIHPDRVIDSYELILVRSGKLGMFEGQRRFTVRAGQALLLRQGRRHGGAEPYPPDLSFYWIHFRIRTPPARARPAYSLTLPSLITVRQPDRLIELYRHFLDDQETGCLTSVTADLLVTLMLGELSNTRRRPGAGEDAARVLAARAERFVSLHLGEPLSTSMIAATLGCNADYLGRVFQKAYGLTLTDSIHRQRHRKARALLLEGTLSIKEIAAACGFDDAGYFRRLFRRREGLSPVAFRRLYAHMHVNTE